METNCHAARERKIMNRQQLLDLYFLEARAKLIDVAAFLDRLDRAQGDGDFRLVAFQQAMTQLQAGMPSRVERILTALSDPTADAIPAATTKAACGAWPGR
jgi:hypothetical protein